MCYLPPSTKSVRPLEVRVPSMAGIKIPTIQLYRTKIYPPSSLKNTPTVVATTPQPAPPKLDIKVIPPQLTTSIPPHPHLLLRHDRTPALDLPDDIVCQRSFVHLEKPVAAASSETKQNESSPLMCDSLPFSSPLVSTGLPLRAAASPPDTSFTIEPPTLYTMPTSSPSPSLHDEDIHDLIDEAADFEDKINPEDAWNLVPYHIPWGSFYHGYKAGTLPGPDGKCIFLRSPTPLKNQRTGQACEKCRERKAKCSGTRPSCARCVARGHECEYSPEIKRTRASDASREEETVLLACNQPTTNQSQHDSPPRQTSQEPNHLTGRAKTSAETTRNKSPLRPAGPLIRRRNTDVSPLSTGPSVTKKRRLSVREKRDLPQSSQTLGAPPFSLGLFSSSSGSSELEVDEPVFAHDTPSTSSDPSEPELYHPLTSTAQPMIFAPHEGSPESPHIKFAEESGCPIYSQSDSEIAGLYSGNEYDAGLPDSYLFSHPNKYPYSPAPQNFATPSILYQRYSTPDVEQAVMFDSDGYPAYPLPEDGEGGDLSQLVLTTLSASTTSALDMWQKDAGNITISANGMNGVATAEPVYPSGLPTSTFMPAQPMLGSAAIAYINNLDLQNVASGYGYEDIHPLDWQTTT